MIAGVLLAAGASRRLGRPKQLLPLGGRPLLAHALGNALASGLDEVVVVLGHEADAIRTALAPDLAAPRSRVVVNPRYAEGQATSVAAGVVALPPETEAALFLLGDQPGVRPETIDAVLAAFRAEPAPIVAPTYGGRIGNPVLFRRDLFSALTGLTGDEGARRLLRARPGDVRRVETGLPAPPPDVDTDDDYRALAAAWAIGTAGPSGR